MLTKHDIAEYYSDPAVRGRILEAVYNKPVLVVQNQGDKKVYRKNHPSGGAINILSASGAANNPKDLAWFTDRRYSEFHPVIGRKTDTVWVDIDPGPDRDTSSLKPVVRKVVSALKKQPGVDSTSITFSGGRGFHVRGVLAKPIDTDLARRKTTKTVKDLAIDGAVFTKPVGDQVRLDTSTLKNKGSLRAPYSINSDTGRIAIPLTERELRGFEPQQADVRRVLSRKEFAPGIRHSKRIYALPQKDKDLTWTMAIQEHLARKAGKHWDLRLVDPETGYAHSWAVPKAVLPGDKSKPVLAVRTPTHTANYAINFGDKGPREIAKGYGKGTVEIKYREPVTISKLRDSSVRFTRKVDGQDEAYALFKTKGDNWLLKRVRAQEKKGSDMSTYQAGFHRALVKLGLADNRSALRSADSQEPIETNARGLPADQLADALSSMEQQEQPEATNAQTGARNRVEDRLNRATTFSQSQEIPTWYMEGPTTTIPGGGF